MEQVILVPFDEGGAMLVEVAPDGREVPFSRAGQAVTKGAQTFQAALAPMRQVARAFYDELAQLPNRPETVKVKFGIQLDADGNAVIAHVGVGVNFEVTLEWGGNDKGPAPSRASAPSLAPTPDSGPSV